MLRHAVVGVALGLFCVCAGPTWAQVGPPASSATPQVDPKVEALVRRYLAAVHIETTVNSMVSAMLPVLAEDIAKRNPAISPADSAKLTDIVLAALREDYTPKLISRMIPIYAATYSASELEAMVGFYESPVGQAVIAKTPSLAPKTAALSRELLPEFQRDVARRVCDWKSCLSAPPAEVPPAKPS